jgi:filamentous hemagglutinin
MQGLQEVHISVPGARGGTLTPYNGQPNTFANLGNGHKIVYNNTGRAIFDVSRQRIKAIEWHQNPQTGAWFNKKTDTKLFENNVPQTVLNALNF